MNKPLASDYFIGMMTGTSLDGLDAVLVDFSQAKPVVLDSVALAYPPALKAEMLALQAGSHGLGINELHRSRVAGIELSHLHASAITQLFKSSGLARKDIAAIGVHGQTVRHHPNCNAPYTVQLIDAATLAESTRCTVISDFRARDIAAGGQGAPLVPAFHAALCAALPKPAALVNIGGFANVTLLHANGDVQGFDTGPGNVLMDAWIALHYGKPYDTQGAWAASGTVNAELLKRLLAHPYFAQPLPKSTGREAFNIAWLDACLEGSDIEIADEQATLCELSAQSIAHAVLQHQADCQHVYVCGGGALNTHLMQRLQALLPCPVRMSDALGVAPQHMEALAFAWLARQCLLGLPSNAPSVTGALGLRVLGTITPA